MDKVCVTSRKHTHLITSEYDGIEFFSKAYCQLSDRVLHEMKGQNLMPRKRFGPPHQVANKCIDVSVCSTKVWISQNVHLRIVVSPDNKTRPLPTIVSDFEERKKTANV